MRVTNNYCAAVLTLAAAALLCGGVPQPQLSVTKTHTGPGPGNAFVVGQDGTYTMVVGNSGPGSTGGALLTLDDPLPSGFAASVVTSTNGWNCSASTQIHVICTNSATIASGGLLGIITVTVTPSIVGTNVANTATVSGPNMLTGTGTDLSDVVVASPDLTITKQHTQNFSQGQSGATYSIAVKNSGTATTSGTVTVADTLPAGLTATAIVGSAWNCTLATLTCTRSDTLSAGNSYPSITVTVDVSGSALPSVTNSATVSGGGEANLANDTATDPTTINPITNVTAGITITQTGFARNRSTGLWNAMITVTNTGATPLTGPLQVTFTNLTPGVTMANASGSRNGAPYLTVMSSGSLVPGASLNALIQFSNPSNGFISFVPVTFSGAF